MPLAKPVVLAGSLDGRALLGELPARAVRLGASEAALVATGQAVDNEWLGGFIAVPRDACLLAYGRAASSVEDLDLAVYSDEGTTLAVD
jgi:hypothetical protein